jgi:hypothetical protein
VSGGKEFDDEAAKGVNRWRLKPANVRWYANPCPCGRASFVAPIKSRIFYIASSILQTVRAGNVTGLTRWRADWGERRPSTSVSEMTIYANEEVSTSQGGSERPAQSYLAALGFSTAVFRSSAATMR